MCSQASIAAFDTPIWKKMMEDYSNSTVLEKYNIEWIKNEAAKNALVDQKAPFLAALIQSIDFSTSSTVALSLKDCTGSLIHTKKNVFFLYLLCF